MSAPFLCELRADRERAVVIPTEGWTRRPSPGSSSRSSGSATPATRRSCSTWSAPGSVDPAGLALLPRIDAVAGRHQVTLMLDLQRADAALLLEA